ncbi:GNAT family N-acetyltransferase [Streptomyces rubellomurinus]|uniref:N-acetyltransferase domain-containing protein n=1 Tax=Streptomyces rubellomurinus (strain ATCC 31215) TaxID=359131 RepID=A0A0F2TMS8_STRR3|nr:GNAT family N-acetyltransferase [Streptomyces rubellomurinus]KJS63032.1 hypothetical protein VM95_05875 [Streptomyces rubellomurinus]
MVTLRTPRLILRRWHESDVAPMAAVRFGFEERGLERIVSIAQAGNDASERIMTKLGMHLARETVHPATGRRVRVYELSSDQYVSTIAR